jgi:hypothetical protein
MTFVPVQNNIRVFHSSFAGVCLSGVNLEILGGTAPYKVHYGAGEVVEVNVNGAGLYLTTIYVAGGNQTITIEDYNECKIDYSLTVPTEAFDVTVDVVAGDCLNEVSIAAAGGIVGDAGYRVMVNGIEKDGMSFFLENGTYEIAVVDMLGCAWVQELVLEGNPLVVDIDVTEGDCLGEVTIAVSGGVEGEDYLVYLNDSEEPLESLTFLGPIGTHTVKVVDAFGCEVEMEFEIMSNPIAVDVAVMEGDCLSLVDLTITGGAAPYEVFLNGADEALAAMTFAGPVGEHTLLVVDAMGCEFETTFEIEGNNTLMVGAAAIGGDCLGSVAVEIEGGIGAYMVTVNGEEVEEYATMWLAPGEYVITVTDELGCSVETSVEVESVPLTISATVVDGSCRNEVTVMVDGGYGDLSVYLNDSETALEALAFNAPVGTHTVKVVDAMGCEAEYEFTVVGSPLTISAMVVDGSCRNEVTVMVAGGFGDLSVYLNDSETALEALAFNAPVGTHTVKVVDAMGCEAEYEFTVVGSPLTISAMVVDGSCRSEVTVMVAGGSGELNVYLNDSETALEALMFNAPVGTHTVKVVDAMGCEAEYEFTVVGSPLTISAMVVDGSCRNEVTVMVAGGFGDLSVYLNDSETALEALAFNAPVGTHTVKVVDAMGCEAEYEFTVVGSPLTISAMVVDGSCRNEVTVMVAGGFGDLSVYLNDSETALEALAFNAPVGTHTVKVVDAMGCEAEYEFTVTGSPLTISAMVVDGSCRNEVTVMVAGGFGDLSVYLNDSETALEALAFNAPVGTHTVKVVDAMGCEAEYEFTVTGSPLTISAMVVDGSCRNEVTVMVAGGSGALKVYLNDSETALEALMFNAPVGTHTVKVVDAMGCEAEYEFTVVGSPLTISAMVVDGSCRNEVTVMVAGGSGALKVYLNDSETALEALAFNAPVGTHTVKVVDAMGCEAEYEFTVTGSPLTISAMVVDGACSNEVTVMVAGGYGDLSVYLNDSETALEALMFNAPVGTHTVKVVDAMGCEAEYEFTVVGNPISLNVAVVAGECTGRVTVSVAGGKLPYLVYLNNGVLENLVFDGPAGTHTIKVVDADGCEVTQTITIVATPVSRTATAHTNKGEGVLFVDAESGISQTLAEGVHTLTYTTAAGCTRTLTVTVTASVKLATIAEVQGTSWESPVKGLIRGLTGTVTGVVPGAGYYIQDAKAAWSGIWVADANTYVLEGLGIYVEGTIAEINGITSIVGKGSIANPPLAITPIVVDSPEVAKSEMYESVLVTVKGARAKAAKPDGTWDVFTTDDNTITIGKWMFLYSPIAGDFYNITGIVNGANDLFRLDPRKAADVEWLKTTDVPVVDVIDFKVYPNPFNNELNIDNANKLTRATITNIAGQRVIDVQYPERVIRTANLVSGVYIVTLFTEDGIVKSERIVKR